MRQYIQIPTDIILSNWWLKNEVCRTLYIELSQRASYRETAELSAGSCFFGRVSFAQKYGYTETKVRTALQILVKNRTIKITPNHTKSIVEVLYISEFLKQKNSQPNNQPNDQPNSQPFNQPNSQPKYYENQDFKNDFHQPNHQPNSQPNSQLNNHKHNSITYNSITGIIDSECCENSQPNAPKTKPTKKTLEEREQDFYNEVAKFVGKYNREILRAFFDYWSEPNKQKNKMRFELQKTWDTGRRLSTWAKREENNFSNSKNNSNGNNQNDNRKNGLSDEEIREAVAGGFALYYGSKQQNNN